MVKHRAVSLSTQLLILVVIVKLFKGRRRAYMKLSKFLSKSYSLLELIENVRTDKEELALQSKIFQAFPRTAVMRSTQV